MLSSSWDGRPFGHNRYGPKRVGGLCTHFRGGGLGLHLTQCGLGRGLPPCQVASWSIQLFGHNASAKKWGRLCPLFMRGALTQCHLGRGLPLYQVASWSIQLFGLNRHEPKTGGCAPLGKAGSTSNTMWPESKPTSMPNFILIHLTVWPQYTNATDRTTVQYDRANRFINGCPRTGLNWIIRKTSNCAGVNVG